MASRASVDRLVLTHLLPPPRNQDEEAAFISDARRGGYQGPTQVAADLLTLHL